MGQRSAIDDHVQPLRLARLDGLRGLAACTVAFAFHTRDLFRADAFDGAGKLVLWFHAYGWTFVDLFFVISGYIFAHVYHGGKALIGKGKLADFAVARFARLYPLHLVMLLFTAAVFWSNPANGAAAFIAQLLMLQAFVQPVGQTFDGPTWSLSVEVICYALFVFGAISGRLVMRVLTGLAIALSLGHMLSHGVLSLDYSCDVLPRAALGFFIGQSLWQARALLARVTIGPLICLFGASLLLGLGASGPQMPLTLLGWPVLLLLAMRLPLFETAPLRWLGDRSYSIYLIHVPLLQLATAQFGKLGGGGLILIGVHFAFAAAVLLLSEAAWRWIEYPARGAIRRAWERRQQRSAGGAIAALPG
jgi:peptidoglycan/LPS O-acetylase OafA/YrhL